MVDRGYVVRVEVKPEHREAFESRLRASAAKIIEEEPGTVAWLAVRVGPGSYLICDAFANEADRQAHLEAGRPRLAALAPMLAEPPTVIATDVIAAKLPGAQGEAKRP